MSSNNRRHVVITGIGPVTPVGTGVDDVWPAIVSGTNGVRIIQGPGADEFVTKLGGQVQDFRAEDWLSPRDVKRADRIGHLAVASAKLAWRDAGDPVVQPERTGAVYGTGAGALGTVLDLYKGYLERGMKGISPTRFPNMMANSGTALVAMEFGFTGPNETVCTACAAGGHAIGTACMAIRAGMADVVLAGGTDASILPLMFNGFTLVQGFSANPDPESAMRPFDKNRDGFIMAEGACTLVLEEAERAVERGARIYAEVVGYGNSADAYHITAPHPEGLGAINAVQGALVDAGEPPEAVDYINAHGTSTPLNDVAETRVIKKVFGDRAYDIPISSTKSMTGHMVGGAGVLEAAVCALAIRHGVIPPTIHLETADPECDLDYVPNEARRATVDVAISNGFGFGGQNSVVAFRRFEP
jgi:3-oxoacyl-[acyl-carrier-protein] synthase II